ncbi:MAG: hypothetical protein ACOCRO_00770 [Halanaerobiales bacterium]
MNIRKYYKDFNANEVFKDTDKIKVSRTVLFLKDNASVFIDSISLAQKEKIQRFLKGNSDMICFKDNTTEETEKQIFIERKSILFTERKPEYILYKEDFGIGVEKDDQ